METHVKFKRSKANISGFDLKRCDDLYIAWRAGAVRMITWLENNATAEERAAFCRQVVLLQPELRAEPRWRKPCGGLLKPLKPQPGDWEHLDALDKRLQGAPDGMEAYQAWSATIDKINVLPDRVWKAWQKHRGVTITRGAGGGGR